MVNHVKGNLLDSNCEYICHQVNCQGVMGSGIAKQIRERFPEVYDHYVHLHKWFLKRFLDPSSMLGTIDIVPLNDFSSCVVNMYSQDNYGYDGSRFTSYDAFYDALKDIREHIPAGKTIGFPKNIGCGLGGANWNVISTMIEEVLGKDYEVYIYEYEPEAEK